MKGSFKITLSSEEYVVKRFVVFNSALLYMSRVRYHTSQNIRHLKKSNGDAKQFSSRFLRLYHENIFFSYFIFLDNPEVIEIRDK